MQKVVDLLIVNLQHSSLYFVDVGDILGGMHEQASNQTREQASLIGVTTLVKQRIRLAAASLPISEDRTIEAFLAFPQHR
jgi:hypothetical protein